MKRLAIRFVVVLGVGLAALWAVTRGDSAPSQRDTTVPVTTESLGGMGTRISAGGKRVHVKPFRGVTFTLFEEAKTDGEALRFLPKAEGRCAKLEVLSAQTQQIWDAVLVAEVAKADDVAEDERRRTLGALFDYEPATEEEAARLRSDADPRAVLRDRRRVTHVRIRAAKARRKYRDPEHVFHFFGNAPSGVEITFFSGVAPVLELRTDVLTCVQPGKAFKRRLFVSSNNLVRMFTPDRLYRLQGVGFSGQFLGSADKSRDGQGVFVLHNEIRFEAEKGLVGSKPGASRHRRRSHETVITCNGPARLRLRQVPKKRKDPKPKHSFIIDHLELRRAVRIQDVSTADAAKGAAVDRLELDLRSDWLGVRVGQQGVESAEARGHVELRADRVETPKAGGAPTASSSTTFRGTRARLLYENKIPARIHIDAWSARIVPTGLGWGPSFVALPFGRGPVVEARFSARTLDDGRLSARCRGDITVENLAPGAKERLGRILLHRDVVADLKGLHRADAAGRKDAPSWVPVTSLIEVQDRLVVSQSANDRIDFEGTGGVRVETLLGILTARDIHGTRWRPIAASTPLSPDGSSRFERSNRWHLVANGSPTLDHPISSRASPGLEKALRSLALTSPVAAARASESPGRIFFRGSQVVFEQGMREGAAPGSGSVRFTEPVSVTQTETGAEPITLRCRDLTLEFEKRLDNRKKKAGAKKDRVALSGFRAIGDVVLTAGKNARGTGDELVFVPEGRSVRGRLTGLPASVAVVDAANRRAVLEGHVLVIDAESRRLEASTGVFARFLPGSGTGLALPGSKTDKVEVKALEIQCERGELGWTEKRDIALFVARDAVRFRGFEVWEASAPARNRLVQWGAADELRFERLATAGTTSSGHRLTLIGQEDDPVVLGYRDPSKPGREDHFLRVPVLVLESEGQKLDAAHVTGYGAGSLFFRSQDDVFGSPRGGATREKSVRVNFPRGFVLDKVGTELYRLDFPDGGEVVSLGPDGKLDGWIKAEKQLSVMLRNAARKADDDLRVIDRGYAEGNVRFKYKDGTEGGCDRAFWERGASTLTIEGGPAWIELPGGGRITQKRIVYNRATRKVTGYQGSARLKKRFDQKAKP